VNRLLGGVQIADLEDSQLDSAILHRKYHYPSEQQSLAAPGGVSTGVGDHPGIHRAESFLPSSMPSPYLETWVNKA